MKSEHRHELAENDLSKILGRWMEKFDEHANKALIAILVAAIIAAVFIFLMRTWSNQRADGWTELAAAATPEDYETIADAYLGTTVGNWARLRAANGFLREGIRQSLTDRPASNDRLEQARTAFESLAESGTHPAVREQALLGLAVVTEAQSNGDTEPAIAAYQNLIEEFPNTRFKQWATLRIDALKTGSVQEFYAWFHKQNPKPPDMPLPKDQGPGTSSKGALDSLLNDLDDSGLPGSSSGTPFDSTPFEIPLSSGSGDGKSTDVDANPFADQPKETTDGETTDGEKTGDPNASEPDTSTETTGEGAGSAEAEPKNPETEAKPETPDAEADSAEPKKSADEQPQAE